VSTSRAGVLVARVVSVACMGCTLSETPCGAGLRLSGGACVAPAEDAVPTPSDSTADASAPADAAVGGDALREPLALGALLVLDRTPARALAETPTTAGCDVDAVALEGSDGEVFAYASRVFGADLLDPFGQGIGLDADEALGAPQGDGQSGTFASLGGSGGFLLLGFEVPRSLVVGDRARIFEVEESGGRDRGDRCAVWRCPDREVDLERCVFLAEVSDDAAVELR